MDLACERTLPYVTLRSTTLHCPMWPYVPPGTSLACKPLGTPLACVAEAILCPMWPYMTLHYVTLWGGVYGPGTLFARVILARLLLWGLRAMQGLCQSALAVFGAWHGACLDWLARGLPTMATYGNVSMRNHCETSVSHSAAKKV